MKKWCLFLSLYLCLCLLAACGAAPVGPENREPDPGDANAAPTSAAEPAATVVCRIISGAEEENLLLAGQGGGDFDVYRLPLGELEITWEDPQDAEAGLGDGALVEVGYSGNVLETFPAQLAGVTSLRVLSGGFDDRCVLYRAVLNDLWETDPGLNDGITQLGVDLSQTSLTAAEQAALAWAFGEDHGLAPIQGTYEELVEQGYITGEPLEGTDAKFWQWEDGCLFSITEQPMEGNYSLVPVTFDAQKWRSGLGAYYFTDCTSVQSAAGHWGDYSVGGEAIS